MKLAIAGLLVFVLIAAALLLWRGKPIPKDATTYALTTVDGTTAPWTLIRNNVQTVEQIEGQLKLEPGATSGKAWTISRIRSGGPAFETQIRTVTRKDERFILDGDSLHVISGRRCARTTVYDVADEGRTLRFRAFRETGEACERTPAEVRLRLDALRSRDRTYERTFPK